MDCRVVSSVLILTSLGTIIITLLWLQMSYTMAAQHFVEPYANRAITAFRMQGGMGGGFGLGSFGDPDPDRSTPDDITAEDSTDSACIPSECARLVGIKFDTLSSVMAISNAQLADDISYLLQETVELTSTCKRMGDASSKLDSLKSILLSVKTDTNTMKTNVVQKLTEVNALPAMTQKDFLDAIIAEIRATIPADGGVR